jgi:predicted dienelactone hydrolase
MYDPFEPGNHEVSTRTVEVADAARSRLFPCEIWRPDATSSQVPLPLVIFSHSSGGNRRSATFLCSHLASHGYVVASMDHSEIVAADLAPAAEETAEQRKARVDAVIGSRVPDVRFLIDYMRGAGLNVDPDRIGLVGHSFGGWTVLAVPEADARIRSVVAMGPGGSLSPRPGILPLSLTFAWDREVPVLYLAAEDDVPIPLDSVRELFDRTPGPRRMFVLRRTDHQHFLDDVEGEHEALRAITLPGDAAWITAAMRPMSELCPGAQAHDFVRGLTLAHLDATVRESHAAERFLAAGADAALAARGVDAAAHPGC